MVKKFLILIFLILLLPFLVRAQPSDIFTLPTVSVSTVLRRLADILFYLLASLALIFVIWGGISFATAGGDPTRIDTAKRMIVFALIGIAVGAIAFGIVNLVVSYLTRVGR
jgi:hypothetical protein